MPEFNFRDALVAVKADTGEELSAAVDDLSTWTDISVETKGQVTMNPTTETARLRPRDSRRRGKVVAGDAAGTAAVTFFRASQADTTAEFFDNIEASNTKRFHLLVQPSRAALLNNAGDVVLSLIHI